MKVVSRQWSGVSIALCAVLFALGSVVEAQPRRVYSIGLVSLGNTESSEISGLRDGLKDAAYYAPRSSGT